MGESSAHSRGSPLGRPTRDIRGVGAGEPVPALAVAAEAGLELDGFQRRAVKHLDEGASVLVSAPTGSGKTLIAEHAIDRALAAGLRAFYTTPIKALSNQKYRDLARRLGPGRAGLLTGDNSIDEDADVVVMTTEVLRNMLYADDLSGRLGVVVLDEVHYLSDAYRGAVWEEVILHLPEAVKLVCLSATVSNHGELGGWLEAVRGSMAVVSESERPVPLTDIYAVEQRRGGKLRMLDTFVDGHPNAAAGRYDANRCETRSGPPRNRSGRSGGRRGTSPPTGRGRRGRGRRHRLPWRPPRRVALLAELRRRDLLPVIWFIFSRKGCDRAAARLASRGTRYTDAPAAERIDRIVESGLAGLSRRDSEALGIGSWAAMIRKGVATHHAGMVPALKEIVERCFIEGLVKVVFATETLALGVNMPARSVVIEKLTKYDGTRDAPLTASQYAQFTGRAGRRGIDEAGYAVVLWSPYWDFGDVAELASSRSFRLRSAFQPTYNMVAGLLGRIPPEQARSLMRRSFAQYQAERGSQRRGSKRSRAGESGGADLTARFDAVAAVLRERGHLDGWTLTPSGELASLIYHEADLALAEALTAGLLDGLSPSALASVLSAFCYEHRSSRPPPTVQIPSAAARHSLKRIERQLRCLNDVERRHRLLPTRPICTGFAAAAHHWAAGVPFHVLMERESLSGPGIVGSAGQFVRNVKVIIDLARRISTVSPAASTASAAHRAAQALDRGIVALSNEIMAADPEYAHPEPPILGSADPLSDDSGPADREDGGAAQRGAAHDR